MYWFSKTSELHAKQIADMYHFYRSYVRYCFILLNQQELKFCSQDHTKYGFDKV